MSRLLLIAMVLFAAAGMPSPAEAGRHRDGGYGMGFGPNHGAGYSTWSSGYYFTGAPYCPHRARGYYPYGPAYFVGYPAYGVGMGFY